MEELFVQESAIATEKATKEQSVPDMQKAVGRKNIEKPVYSHEEAVEESIQYFKGDELAARVWTNKYALKDSFGNLYEKTPDDMHRRLAREIHRVELKYKKPAFRRADLQRSERFQIYCSSGRTNDRHRE